MLAGFDADGLPRLRPPRLPITLRHPLTQIAGFAYEIWSAALLAIKERTGVPSIFTYQNAALRIPLLYSPGEDGSYGIGIDWAGKMPEAVIGHRLGVAAVHAVRSGPTDWASRRHARGPEVHLDHDWRDALRINANTVGGGKQCIEGQRVNTVPR